MKYTYHYDEQPSGSYSKPSYHCVEKRLDGKFEWSWSFKTEELARNAISRWNGKDIKYPGK